MMLGGASKVGVSCNPCYRSLSNARPRFGLSRNMANFFDSCVDHSSLRLSAMASIIDKPLTNVPKQEQVDHDLQLKGYDALNFRKMATQGSRIDETARTVWP